MKKFAVHLDSQHSQDSPRGFFGSWAFGLWLPMLVCLTCATKAHASPSWSHFDQRVQKWMKSSSMKGARVGIAVSNRKGKLLYQYNASKKFFPASNTKLITMAATLSKLGSNYRFVTKIYSKRPISKAGELRGNLYIRGSGDPLLRSEELWRISRDLYNLGLRRIRGRVVFDDYFFDRVGFGKGWRHHKHQWYRPYLAPIGGLSLNFNALGVVVRPGRQAGRKARIVIDPPSRYIRRIVNRTRTVQTGRFRIKIKVLSHRGWRDTIVVQGTVPVYAKAKTYWRRINHPGWYTAFAFADALRKQRIRVSAYPKRRRVPPAARVLYKHYSPSLLNILLYTGKFSSNFATEQLLKTLGAETYGVPGTWKKGLKASKDFMKQLGISEAQYKMVNGSGLGRINQFSPLQFVAVLRAMYNNPTVRTEFVLSQPTAGRDGTLRRRMKEPITNGRIRAKTGTIDGISTLSGYVTTQSGQVLVFSFCMNSKKSHVVKINRRLRKRMQRQTRAFRRFQNELGALLATYPTFKK